MQRKRPEHRALWPPMNFTLLDDTDVSRAYAAYLRELRQQASCHGLHWQSEAACLWPPLRNLS
ncbi:MAG: hypothetical protein QG557_1073 [Pseudomonadota bacterium]|nr:hypothetical protein [Pseudomonadota bacterium]